LVILFDAASGEPLPHQFPAEDGHRSNATFLRFDRDGRQILSSGWDETLRVWDVVKRRLAGPPIEVGLRVWDATFSPDGAMVAEGFSDGSASGRVGGYAAIWESKSGHQAVPLMGPTDDVTSIDFSPDGDRVVASSTDGTVILWNTAGTQLATLRGHRSRVNSVRFSRDGRWLLTTAEDGTARVWEAGLGLFVAGVGRANRRVVGHDEELVRFVMTTEDNKLPEVGAMGSNLVTQLIGYEPASVTSAEFNPRHDQILTSSESGGGEIWVASTGQFQFSLPKHTRTATFSPDGARIATGQLDGAVCLWEAQGRAVPVCRQAGNAPVTLIVFDPYGRFILAVSESKVAYVMPVIAEGPVIPLGRDKPPLLGHWATVERGAVSPDGSLIATGGDDGQVILWEAATGRQLLAPLNPHSGIVLQVVFSPLGELLAAATAEKQAFVWSVPDGQLRASLAPHGDVVSDLAFSPLENVLATAAGDGALRLWSTIDGKLLAEYLVPFEKAQEVAYAGSGKTIFLKHANGDARLLPVSDRLDILIGKACADLPRRLTATEKAAFFIGPSVETCNR
jgi:WD40 repeat protein